MTDVIKASGKKIIDVCCDMELDKKVFKNIRCRSNTHIHISFFEALQFCIVMNFEEIHSYSFLKCAITVCRWDAV